MPPRWDSFGMWSTAQTLLPAQNSFTEWHTVLSQHMCNRYSLAVQVTWRTTLPAVLNQANDVRETRYRHWLFAGKHWISRDWMLRRADINNNNKENKKKLLRKRGRKGSYGEVGTQWARWMEREKRYIGKTVCNELVTFYTHSQNKRWYVYNQDEPVSTNSACLWPLLSLHDVRWVKRNQLDATYFIIYSILIQCSTCFGR